ncbi:uncharacterized protein DKFZp434B061-like [Ananas comosus]|uniref:Uncharacterized protein DKFZp434B061-like n=1 Tax=Ananas comosus TaxID=4615 RepID=A0A6P5G546_ANACO|nr:uncharacterized protein DKFZp434B061-like [Ananas comosus]
MRGLGRHNRCGRRGPPRRFRPHFLSSSILSSSSSLFISGCRRKPETAQPPDPPQVRPCSGDISADRRRAKRRRGPVHPLAAGELRSRMIASPARKPPRHAVPAAHPGPRDHPRSRAHLAPSAEPSPRGHPAAITRSAPDRTDLVTSTQRPQSAGPHPRASPVSPDFPAGSSAALIAARSLKPWRQPAYKACRSDASSSGNAQSTRAAALSQPLPLSSALWPFRLVPRPARRAIVAKQPPLIHQQPRTGLVCGHAFLRRRYDARAAATGGSNRVPPPPTPTCPPSRAAVLPEAGRTTFSAEAEIGLSLGWFTFGFLSSADLCEREATMIVENF